METSRGREMAIDVLVYVLRVEAFSCPDGLPLAGFRSGPHALAWFPSVNSQQNNCILSLLKRTAFVLFKGLLFSLFCQFCSNELI